MADLINGQTDEALIEEALRAGLAGINAAYQEATAEQQGHDRTADKCAAVVRNARKLLKAALASRLKALSSLPPGSGGRDLRKQVLDLIVKRDLRIMERISRLGEILDDEDAVPPAMAPHELADAILAIASAPLPPPVGVGVGGIGSDGASPAVVEAVSRTAPQQADETAWLIEETWSGYVHYVHRDFDAVRWREERDSLKRLPFEWIFNDTGGATLTRRCETIPFIIKSAEEAMRFETEDDALEWLGMQPRWISHGDQFQAREHMWVRPLEGRGNPSQPNGATPNPPPLPGSAPARESDLEGGS